MLLKKIKRHKTFEASKLMDMDGEELKDNQTSSKDPKNLSNHLPSFFPMGCRIFVFIYCKQPISSDFSQLWLHVFIT